jgi:hypothetical protein
VTKDALTKIPKRDRRVIEDGNGREIFWGLYAVEVVSFATVVMYHTIILVGPFVFWALWIAKKPKDLQNASVPVLTVLGMLSLFWVILMYK